MRLSMPFLYLPDAISLVLLLIILDWLRRSAIIHLNQELLGIRNELLCYWSDNNLPFSNPAYLNLMSRIESAVRLADKLSPARLFFVRRCVREMEKQGEQSTPHQTAELGAQMKFIQTERVRKKLRRIELEINLLLGVFLLFASVSGWILLLAIVSRVVVRLFSRRYDSMVDYVFDLAERLVPRLGSRALRIALISESATS